MDGLMRSVALEEATHGVTCNVVQPGWIATASSSSEEIASGTATPSGRPGRPQEVASAITFLAGLEAGYVTGQTIVVDGGNLLQEHNGR